MLCLRNFSRYIGYTCVIQKINLNLLRGDVACLLGANGAGKSIFLSTLSASRVLYEGKCFFSEKNLNEDTARREFLKSCAYLGHSPGLFYDLTVEENINFFGEIFSSLYFRQKKEHLLEMVGLIDRRKQKVIFLSQGLKQRLGLVRCFLQSPKLILFDEPLNSLDQQGIRVFRSLLEQAISEGCTALITSHIEGFFMENEIASRFLFLKKGRLVADISAHAYSKIAQDKVKKILEE